VKTTGLVLTIIGAAYAGAILGSVAATLPHVWQTALLAAVISSPGFMLGAFGIWTMTESE